ncbi:IPT/TIG domain-containing protein [Pontibacter locisalis]|uniref:IPT/TIG domain-containing protein n=1 Tax=Pontibacter locisalis TaxID=1719035 RepID=A0ABW5IKK6_9BACT
MNRTLFTRVILFLLLPLFLTFCQTKEKISPREYPRVYTEAVTDINNSGATFTGTIKTLGTAPITDHGFVWSDKPYVFVDYSSRASLGAKQASGDTFNTTATFAMQAGKTHYVRAYVRSGEYVVYGPLVSFISNGSLPPVLNSFSPATARINEYVTITGQNFTQDLTRLKVLFGSTAATVISATPDTLVCMVPYNLQTTQVKITVQVVDKSVASASDFTLIK